MAAGASTGAGSDATIVGVLGGGQLGRMLAEARPDVGFRFLDPSPEACARERGEHVCAAWDDASALDRLAEGAAALTWEFENVPAAALDHLAARGARVYPSRASLVLSSDRVREKRAFEEAGLAVPPWRAVDDPAGIPAALEAVVDPGADDPAAMLKARSGGYDGKGQAVVRPGDDPQAAWRAIGGVPAILERRVPFRRELSVCAARGRDGSMVVLPPVENEHVDGILHRTRAPAAEVDEGRGRALEDAVRRFAEALDHVGVFVIELFDLEGGPDADLAANEVAARVHNSYHWTQDGASASQFALHDAAVLGEPLPAVEVRGATEMVNLVGGVPDLADRAGEEGVHVHLYGKSPRPGRKLGHVNVTGPDAGAVAAIADDLAARALAARVAAVASA